MTHGHKVRVRAQTHGHKVAFTAWTLNIIGIYLNKACTHSHNATIITVTHHNLVTTATLMLHLNTADN